MKSSINTSSSRTHHVPIIDLAAGPFADAQDPTLDTHISGFSSHPALPPISAQPYIPARDAAWQAHLSHLRAWHTLELRVTASEVRARHAVIIRELNAMHAEETQDLNAAHDRDLLNSQQRFAGLFGGMLQEKNAEIDHIIATKDHHIHLLRSQMSQEHAQLVNEMTHMSQLNAALSNALQQARLSFPPTAFDNITIHHPNNAKRAKDIRLEQPSWTTLENLSQWAGGLPIRKQRIDLGLPTPKDVLETVRIMGGTDWVAKAKSPRSVSGDDSVSVSAGAGAVTGWGRYERGNASVTRSGRLIQRQTQTHKQGPRSARTAEEVERGMQLKPLAYKHSSSYKVPLNTARSAGEKERKEQRKEVLGQIEDEIEREHAMQESIDRSVAGVIDGAGTESAHWGPGPAVPNSACGQKQTGVSRTE